jgi:hypothetical protein
MGDMLNNYFTVTNIKKKGTENWAFTVAPN